MIYQLAADFIVLLHFVFIVFVLFGGFMVFKWRWLVWIQVPAAIWGALISLIGWTCPLTPMENQLRLVAGTGDAYSGGFIDRYLVKLVYPEGTTHEMAIAMGIAVIVINVVAYVGVWAFSKRKRPPVTEA